MSKYKAIAVVRKIEHRALGNVVASSEDEAVELGFRIVEDDSKLHWGSEYPTDKKFEPNIGEVVHIFVEKLKTPGKHSKEKKR